MILLIQNIAAIFLISLHINLFHAIHISYGEAALTKYEIRGKVTFSKDDFMLALKNWKGRSLNNLSNKEFDHLKSSYLQNHFFSIVNGNKKLLLAITGNNENDNSIWFSFKFNSDEIIKSLEMENSVLINEFSDQMNLLNVSSSAGEQSFIFDESKPKLKIKS